MPDYPTIFGGVLTDLISSINPTIGTQAAIVAGLLGIDFLFRRFRRVYEDWRADNDSSYGRY